MDELVAGVKVFSSHCTFFGDVPTSRAQTQQLTHDAPDFQLGFLPRALFLERLAEQRESISVFLLLAILSISARFTPALVRRYDGALKATDYFMQRAAILVPQELYTPSLERCQAFFLLGIADWGNGERHRSFVSSFYNVSASLHSCLLPQIHLGVAVRMAGLLRLHLETTYQPSLTATPDDIIQSEVARRTFWMLNSQDDLHSGNLTPASFVLADVTALLPSDEIDFAFGREPTSRAALAGTRAALTNPLLATLPDRSLFATLVQAVRPSAASSPFADFGPACSTTCGDRLLGARVETSVNWPARRQVPGIRQASSSACRKR